MCSIARTPLSRSRGAVVYLWNGRRQVFDDAPMGEAGVVLLVFFLCVMNVTLLNLLIAILATAHGRVEQNADKEAMLSEALIITQYR